MKKIKKSIACLAVALFIVNQLGSSTVSVASTGFHSEVKAPSHFQIDLPSDLGTIENLISGSGPAIIHIQTAHGNYEAQKRIQAILHYLKNAYGFKLLFLEGSASKLNPELLRFFPQRMDLTMKMADELTKQALVKGDELFLLEEPEAEAYGIEGIEAYRKNREAFRVVLTQKEKTEGFLRNMDMQIERLTGPCLNKDLRNFLKRLDSFEAKRLPILDWLNYLKTESKQHLELDLTDPRNQIDWPMLLRLYKLREFESELDLNAFAKERDEFFKAIRIPKETLNKIKKLLSSPLSQNQLPDPDTGLLFEKLVSYLPDDFNYADYPNLTLFIGHLILQSELKGDRLMEEMNRLTDNISRKLAKTKEAQKILSLFKDYRLLKKLFALDLISEDYEEILKRRETMEPGNIAKRFLKLNETGRVKNISFEHLNEINFLFDEALEFYQGTKERDHWMLDNIQARLKETGQTKAVVITGGFHSKPFKWFFQAKGFNYALISPKITSVEGHEAYLEAALQNSTHPLKKSTMDLPRRMEPINIQAALGENVNWVNGRINLTRQRIVKKPHMPLQEENFKIPTFRSEARKEIQENFIKALAPDVQLTAEEIKKYFGTAILEKSKKENRHFYLRNLNPEKDTHFIEEWKQEIEAHPGWYQHWENKANGYVDHLPRFSYLAPISFGLISETNGKENLEGYIGLEPMFVGFDASAGKFTFRLTLPQMELYYRNIGSQRELKGVSDLLFDFLIKFAADKSNFVTGGIIFHPVTPGAHHFADRRKLEAQRGGDRFMPQSRVESEYQISSLENLFNARRSEMRANEKEFKQIAEAFRWMNRLAQGYKEPAFWGTRLMSVEPVERNQPIQIYDLKTQIRLNDIIPILNPSDQLAIHTTLSPDERFLTVISFAEDKRGIKANIFDLDNEGKELEIKLPERLAREYSGETNPSFLGKRLLAARPDNGDEPIQVYDLKTMTRLNDFIPQLNVSNRLAIHTMLSPDERFLIVTSSAENKRGIKAAVFDLDDKGKELVLKLPESLHSPYSGETNPAFLGKRLLAARPDNWDEPTQIYDLKTRTRLNEIIPDLNVPDRFAVRTMLSPDERFLIITSYDEKRGLQAKVFDLDNGGKERSLNLPIPLDRPYRDETNPGFLGKRLMYAEPDRRSDPIQIYDLKTLTYLNEIIPVLNTPERAARLLLSPDERFLVVTLPLEDGRSLSAKMFDLDHGGKETDINLPASLDRPYSDETNPSFSSRGRLLYAKPEKYGDPIDIYDLKAMRNVRDLIGKANNTLLSPEERFLAAFYDSEVKGNEEIKVFDLDTGQELALDIPPVGDADANWFAKLTTLFSKATAGKDFSTKFSFSQGGKIVRASYAGLPDKIVDIKSALDLKALTGPFVREHFLSPDERYLVVQYETGSIRVIDLDIFLNHPALKQLIDKWRGKPFYIFYAVNILSWLIQRNIIQNGSDFETYYNFFLDNFDKLNSISTDQGRVKILEFFLSFAQFSKNPERIRSHFLLYLNLFQSKSQIIFDDFSKQGLLKDLSLGSKQAVKMWIYDQIRREINEDEIVQELAARIIPGLKHLEALSEPLPVQGTEISLPVNGADEHILLSNFFMDIGLDHDVRPSDISESSGEIRMLPSTFPILYLNMLMHVRLGLIDAHSQIALTVQGALNNETLFLLAPLLFISGMVPNVRFDEPLEGDTISIANAYQSYIGQTVRHKGESQGELIRNETQTYFSLLAPAWIPWAIEKINKMIKQKRFQPGLEGLPSQENLLTQTIQLQLEWIGYGAIAGFDQIKKKEAPKEVSSVYQKIKQDFFNFYSELKDNNEHLFKSEEISLLLGQRDVFDQYGGTPYKLHQRRVRPILEKLRHHLLENHAALVEYQKLIKDSLSQLKAAAYLAYPNTKDAFESAFIGPEFLKTDSSSRRSEARNFERKIQAEIRLLGDTAILQFGPHQYKIISSDHILDLSNNGRLLSGNYAVFIYHAFLAVLTLMQESRLTQEIKPVLEKFQVHYSDVTSKAVLSLGKGAPGTQLEKPFFQVDYIPQGIEIQSPNGNHFHLDVSSGQIAKIEGPKGGKIRPLTGSPALVQRHLLKIFAFLPAILNEATREQALTDYQERGFEEAIKKLSVLVDVNRSEIRNILSEEARTIIEKVTEKLLRERFRFDYGQSAFEIMVRQLADKEDDVSSQEPVLLNKAIDSVPTLAQLITSTSQTKRQLVDYRQIPHDPVELDALVLYAAYHPDVAYNLYFVAPAEKATAFKSELRQHVKARHNMALPKNFNIESVETVAALTSRLNRLFDQAAKAQIPSAFITVDPSLAELGYRPNLLRAIGSSDPILQNATALLTGERLLEELPIDMLIRIHRGADLDRDHIWDSLVADLHKFTLLSSAA